MKSIAQIEEIRKKTIDRIIIRKDLEALKESKVRHVMVCAGTGCTS